MPDAEDANARLAVANPQHLDIFKQGVGVWNGYRREFGRLKPDLSRISLDGMALDGADFSKTDLIATKLRGASLNHANFTAAHLALYFLGQASVRPI